MDSDGIGDDKGVAVDMAGEEAGGAGVEPGVGEGSAAACDDAGGAVPACGLDDDDLPEEAGEESCAAAAVGADGGDDEPPAFAGGQCVAEDDLHSIGEHVAHVGVQAGEARGVAGAAGGDEVRGQRGAVIVGSAGIVIVVSEVDHGGDGEGSQGGAGEVDGFVLGPGGVQGAVLPIEQGPLGRAAEDSPGEYEAHDDDDHEAIAEQAAEPSAFGPGGRCCGGVFVGHGVASILCSKMQGIACRIQMDLEDPELLSRLRGADPAAFETLVRAMTGRLLATARRFLRDDALAQDAVQDAFLQAYRALPAFEGRSSLSTWLHTITVRTCLMRLRHDRSHPEARIEDLLPTFASDGHRQQVGPAWQPPEELSSDERALVRGCIEKLPEDFRNVLLLRDIEEVDTRGAAELLGISEGLVKARLHRARQALRTLLDPHFRKERL